MFKQGFELLMRQFEETILVHRKYGAASPTTTPLRGMKNNKKGNTDVVMFQFAKVEDVQQGDVLQREGARELWKVTETNDRVTAGTFICFEAHVEKLTAGQLAAGGAHRTAAAASSRSHVVINAPIHGNVQIGSHGSSQTASVSVSSEVHNNIQTLKRLIGECGEISSLDREEAASALDRIADLASREKTPEVIELATKKVGLVKSVIELSATLITASAPYWPAIQHVFTASN